jgi:hypothetical protein
MPKARNEDVGGNAEKMIALFQIILVKRSRLSVCVVEGDGSRATLRCVR